jgi:hypothetical protein
MTSPAIVGWREGGEVILRAIDFETLSLDPEDGVCEVARCDILSVAEPENWCVTQEEARFVNPGRPIPASA